MRARAESKFRKRSHRVGRAVSAGLLATVWMAASATQALAAQDVSKWSGVWEMVGSYNFDPNIPQREADKPPYTPEFAAKAAAALEGERIGKPINDPGTVCLPRGGVMMMLNVYPMEIIGTPNQITFIAEYLTQVRRVYLDGRKHPDEPDPSFNGHSIGHWEGDVLVVDTIGFRDNNTLTKGLPLGPELHMVERMHQQDANTFVDEITLTGKAFTKPYAATRYYKRNPKLEIMEYLCENNRNPVNADGVTGVQLKSGDATKEVYLK